MTYGWSIRAGMFEKDDASPACGKVHYAPHPRGPDARTVCPIGGFSLAIPTGLDDKRKRASWKMMEYLTRPEMLKWYVLNGNPSSPRFSTSADPEVQASSPIISKVDAMDRQGILQSWPRPPIPEFSQLLNILGDDIHAMLQGSLSVSEALTNSQNQIDLMMRDSGYY